MDDRGVTLIELAMVIVIVLVVAFIVGDSVVTGVRAYYITSDRGDALENGRMALERVVREVRNGIEISNATATATELCFDDMYGSTISFRYAGTQILREEVSGGLPACPDSAGTTLADGITAFAFSYIQNSGISNSTPVSAKRVGISLTSTAGDESIELRTEAYPVNAW